MSQRGWIYQKTGDRYELALVPKLLDDRLPQDLGSTQVRIAVGAVSLNYRDLIALRNKAGRNVDRRIPASDGAGRVVEVGSKVKQWKVGDRVAGCFFQTWQEGRFEMRHHKNDLGGTLDGMLADQVVLEESGIVAIPSWMSELQASTLPCAALTAWYALMDRGGLRAEDTVLALGTGGVSIFALQFATAAGAKVAITSSSDAKLIRVKRMGAWQTVNYRSEVDWDKSLLKATDQKGIDHVIETGGPGTLEKSMNVVAAGGQIAQIGVLTGFGPPSTSLFPIVARNVRLDGIYVGPRQSFVAMNQFIDQHRIEPVIDQVFSFEEADKAFEYLESGQHLGKVVISNERNRVGR
jgi:NADPH:quinone reductase-like Zn-dependent oxidoreductase